MKPATGRTKKTKDKKCFFIFSAWVIFEPLNFFFFINLLGNLYGWRWVLATDVAGGGDAVGVTCAGGCWRWKVEGRDELTGTACYGPGVLRVPI